MAATGRGRGRRVGECFALAGVVTVIALAGIRLGWLTGFWTVALDSGQPRGAAPDVVVVAIDGDSIAASGEAWPWPRSMQAELLSRVAAAGPRVIALDVIYAEPGDRAEDVALAAAIDGAGNVVLASDSSAVRPSAADRPFAATRHHDPASTVRGSAPSGHPVVVPDDGDGVVRSVPLLLDDGGRLRPALALAALARYDGVEPIARSGAGVVQVGTRSVPVGSQGELVVSFSPELLPSGSAVVPAATVLAPDFDAARLRGKAVFIGVTDGASGDQFLTPSSKQAAGVLIHADAFNTMLTEAYVAPVPVWHDALAVALLAVAVALLVRLMVLPVGVALGAVTLAVYLLWGLLVRVDSGAVPNLAWPLVGGVVAGVAAGVSRFTDGTRAHREVVALFSRYVPEPVVRQLLAGGRVDEEAAGVRRDACMLFCDLRGFTALAATLDPGDVRDMLDHYYDFGTSIVFEEGGTLLQYVGDEIFAVFGVPVDDPRASDAAVRCAERLQRERARLDRALTSASLPTIHYGIGVHRGEVVAAHVGPRDRRQYGVVGDAVNVAARLCSAAGVGEVVVSSAVLDGCAVRPSASVMPGVALKGVPADFQPWKLDLVGVESSAR